MLKNSPIGDIIIELSEIDSTNNYAMRLVDEGMAEHGTVIRADYQSAGRGQMGNTWLAEESKNLLCSVIIDTSTFPIEQQFYLNAVTCLAVADMLMSVYQIPNVSIKWPNDIYAAHKKIAGILIENSIRGSQWSHAIVGIGLNVNQQIFPDINRATSMVNITGQKNRLNQVLKNLLKIYNQYFKKMGSQQSELLLAFNQNLYAYQREIHFLKKNETYKGIVQGVNPQGEIEIMLNGKVKKFKHKEIELMLP